MTSLAQSYFGQTWCDSIGVEQSGRHVTVCPRVSHRIAARVGCLAQRFMGLLARVPDFATTAHMAQGQSLPALFCCVDTDPVAAYVMLSRTTALETLAILRPFASRLFRGGPPLGRQLLLRKFLEADKIHNTNNFGDCRNVCPTSGFDSRNS